MEFWWLETRVVAVAGEGKMTKRKRPNKKRKEKINVFFYKIKKEKEVKNYYFLDIYDQNEVILNIKMMLFLT